MSVISTSRAHLNQSFKSSRIEELIDRYDNANSSIPSEFGTTSLNLSPNDKQHSKYKFDQSMALAKLRNIQNKSEMNRAEVELSSMRKIKIYNRSLSNKKQNKREDEYINIYNKFKKEINKKDERYEEEENSEQQEQLFTEEGPKGIKHFNLLKKHPKILEFTLQKMKSKNVEEITNLKKAEEKQLVKESQKKALKHQDYKEILESQKKSKIDELESPKAIVDNKLCKFYTKSLNTRINSSVKANPRCNSILERQSKMLFDVEDSHISDQNMKKLKEKLNEIVNEISKNDKRSKSKESKSNFLPILPQISFK